MRNFESCVERGGNVGRSRVRWRTIQGHRSDELGSDMTQVRRTRAAADSKFMWVTVDPVIPDTKASLEAL